MTTPKPARERADEIVSWVQEGIRPQRFPGRMSIELCNKLEAIFEELDILKFQVANWERKEVQRASCCAAYEEEARMGRAMRDEFLFSDHGSERPIYFLDYPESLYSYDIVRKRNEKDGL